MLQPCFFVVVRAPCGQLTTESESRQRKFSDFFGLAKTALQDWKALRDQAGLTLDQLAELFLAVISAIGRQIAAFGRKLR